MKSNNIIYNFNIIPYYLNYDENYWNILIFETTEDMYDYYKETGGTCELIFKGVHRPNDELMNKDIPVRKLKNTQIGKILLSKEFLTHETIAHELTHMCFTHFEYIFYDETFDFRHENSNGDKLYWAMEEQLCSNLSKALKDFYTNVPLSEL